MNQISEYLASTGTSQAEFARRIGISQSQVYQFLKGIRPVSERLCVRIERATEGRLTRQALRPDDWQDIWPELAHKEVA